MQKLIKISALSLISLLVLSGCGKQAAQPAKTSSSSKSSQVVKVASSKASSSQSSQSVTKTKTTKSAKTDTVGDALANLTTKLPEDTATQNNNELTYSRFYQSNQHWYWELSSSKRGVFAEGQVKSLSKQNDGYLLSMQSNAGQQYQLQLTWLDDQHQSYQVQTSYLNISGKYSADYANQSSQSSANNSNVDTKNLTEDQLIDWAWLHYAPNVTSGFGREDFLFMFNQEDDGTVSVDIRENHDSKHMRAAHMARSVAPRVATYRVNAKGELESYDVAHNSYKVVATQYGE